MKKEIKIIACAVLLAGMGMPQQTRTGFTDFCGRVGESIKQSAKVVGHSGLAGAAALITLCGLRNLLYEPNSFGKFFSTGFLLGGGVGTYYLDRTGIDSVAADLAKKISRFTPRSTEDRVALVGVLLGFGFLTRLILPYGVMGLRQRWSGGTALVKEYQHIDEQIGLAERYITAIMDIYNSLSLENIENNKLVLAKKLLEDFITGRGVEDMPFLPTTVQLERACLFAMGDNAEYALRYYGGNSLVNAFENILQIVDKNRLEELSENLEDQFIASLNKARQIMTNFIDSCKQYERKLHRLGPNPVKKQEIENKLPVF